MIRFKWGTILTTNWLLCTCNTRHIADCSSSQRLREKLRGDEDFDDTKQEDVDLFWFLLRKAQKDGSNKVWCFENYEEIRQGSFKTKLGSAGMFTHKFGEPHVKTTGRQQGLRILVSVVDRTMTVINM